MYGNMPTMSVNKRKTPEQETAEKVKKYILEAPIRRQKFVKKERANIMEEINAEIYHHYTSGNTAPYVWRLNNSLASTYTEPAGRDNGCLSYSEYEKLIKHIRSRFTAPDYIFTALKPTTQVQLNPLNYKSYEWAIILHLDV